MAKINFGGVVEEVVTREEFPLAKAREVLKNETIAVLGYGVQGPAQSQNMRDNGFKVIIGQEPKFKREWDKAIADGWVPGKTLFPIEEAARKAMVDAEVAWLDADLAATGKPWKMVDTGSPCTMSPASTTRQSLQPARSWRSSPARRSPWRWPGWRIVTQGWASQARTAEHAAVTESGLASACRWVMIRMNPSAVTHARPTGAVRMMPPEPLLSLSGASTLPGVAPRRAERQVLPGARRCCISGSAARPKSILAGEPVWMASRISW